jgi:hypothetical protein
MYWTPEVHVAAFAHPRFIADLVAQTDGTASKIGRKNRNKTAGAGRE